MIKPIKTPCLPSGELFQCLIGERYSKEIKELTELGIECVTLRENPLLEDEISCHADILAFNFGNGQVLLNKGAIGEKELKNVGITPIFYSKEICSPYPNDIPLNVAYTGKHIICNSKHTAREIIEFAETNNIEIINTKQGYSTF